MTKLPESAAHTADSAILFTRYLDFYRAAAVRKVTSVPDEERRRTRLPSGWTPLEMLWHLAHMERRWIMWGFLGEAVEEPWADQMDGHWRVPDGLGLDEVAGRLQEVGRRTTSVLAARDLGDIASAEGRFGARSGQGAPVDGESDSEVAPPTLAWICFHILQEYARHVGHLDIAVELAGGPVGE